MTTTNMVRLKDGVRMTCGRRSMAIRMEMYDVLKEFFQRTDAWLLEVPVYSSPIPTTISLIPAKTLR